MPLTSHRKCRRQERKQKQRPKKEQRRPGRNNRCQFTEKSGIRPVLPESRLAGTGHQGCKPWCPKKAKWNISVHMEEEGNMKMQKCRLLGMLLLAGALCLTGCGYSTDPTADVMEGEVPQPVMQEDSADSAYRADDDTVPEESSQSSALPPLSTEARTIDYKGSVSVDWLTASSDAIYLLSRERDGGSGILKMKPGEADGEVLQVTAPDGMVFSVMTTDEQGNLYVVAEDRDIEAVMRDDEVVCPTEHCEVWRVSPSGEVAAKLDISEYVKQEVFSPRMIAVAGNGDIYLSTQNDGTAVLAFDAEGNFLNKISYDYKVYTLRTAMGRGRDGKVYAVLWDSIANDGTSVIVELDGRNGSIGDVTSFLLHSDGSFYNCVCPGRDCDLVIFGGQGILGYDLGSASIKWKVPAGELPFSTEGYFPMATLPDGRVLFLDRNYKWDEDDPTNMWVVAEGTKFHYVPAARQ